MRTPLTRMEQAVGLFVVAVVVALVIASSYGGAQRGVAGLVRRAFTVEVMVDDAHGVRVGSPVQIHGVEVGTVKDVRLAPRERFPGQPVLLALEVDPGAAVLLRMDTEAVVESGMPPFLLGIVHLRSQEGPPLDSGTAVSATWIKAAPHAMLASMDEGSRTMTRMLSQVERATESLTTVFDRVSRGKGLAARLVNDPELGDEMERLVTAAKDTTGSARRMFDRFDRAARDASSTIEKAGRVTDDVRRVANGAEAGLSDVRRALAAAERTVRLAEDLVRSLRTTASYAPELARKADTSLHETQRLVKAAQKSFLVRSLLDESRHPPTEAQVRPPAVLPGQAPREAPSAHARGND